VVPPRGLGCLEVVRVGMEGPLEFGRRLFREGAWLKCRSGLEEDGVLAGFI